MTEAEKLYNYFIHKLRLMGNNKIYNLKYEYENDRFIFTKYNNYKDYKGLAEYIKTVKKTKLPVKVNIPIKIIVLKIHNLSQKEPYITINVKSVYAVYISLLTKGCTEHQEIFIKTYSKIFSSIIFFNSEKIYCNIKNKMFPANLRTFSFTDNIVRDTLFEFFRDTQKNMLWEDLKREEEEHVLPSIKIGLISASFNKKQLLQKIFPDLSIPNSCNRGPFCNMYAACCAAKYVDTKQIPLLFSANKVVCFRFHENKYGYAVNYLLQYFLHRHHLNENYINDYYDALDMIIKKFKKVDLLMGKKILLQLHERLMIEDRCSKSKIKLVIPDTPLSKIQLPPEFSLIRTNKQLIEESVKANNCVWSYIDRINKGKCLIYSLEYNDEHCTVEIGYRYRKFYLLQLEVANHQKASEETVAFIKKSIENANNARKKCKLDSVKG